MNLTMLHQELNQNDNENDAVNGYDKENEKRT